MRGQKKVFLSLCGILFLTLLLTLSFPAFLPGRCCASPAAGDVDLSWEQQYLLDWNELILDISAVDESTAWCLATRMLDDCMAESTVLRTRDAGESWEYLEPDTGAPLFGIAAVDANTAWAVGEGVIAKTNDGGATWAVQDVGASCRLLAVSAPQEECIWAAGYEVDDGYPAGCRGIVLRTTDGGDNWSIIYEEEGVALYDISATDADAAWVSMWGGALHTDNGGLVWEAHELPLNETYPKVSSLDEESAWFLGCVDDIYGRELAVFTTTDGGSTWSHHYFGFTPSNTMLAGIDAVDADTAWVVAGLPGADPESGHGYIWRTVDGGYSWSEVDPGFEIRGLASCAAMGDTVLCGGMGFILRAVSSTPPGPSVTSVSPASAAQFTLAVDLQVEGSGFEPGAAVRLEKGAMVIDAYNVNVVSGELITCTVGLFGAEPGLYDVVVMNPDGKEARLPAGFTVTSPCGAGGGAAVLLLGLALGFFSLAAKPRGQARKSA